MPPPGEPPDPAGTGPQPPYGYPYPPPRRTNGNALASMVVSLAGLVTCPLLGGIGVYLGYRARDEMARSGEEGDGMALAGIIVGWVGIGVFLLMLCLILLIAGGARLMAP